MRYFGTHTVYVRMETHGALLSLRCLPGVGRLTPRHLLYLDKDAAWRLPPAAGEGTERQLTSWSS